MKRPKVETWHFLALDITVMLWSLKLLCSTYKWKEKPRWPLGPFHPPLHWICLLCRHQPSLLLLLLSHFSRIQLWPHRRQPTRLPRPWDSPGKNTGVDCHFLLQCMKVKSESEVAQSYSTFSDLMDHSLPGSSVCGIFQARVLEWGAIAFSVYKYI